MDYVVYVWLIAAAICLLAEIIGTDFVLLMVGGGALGGALMAFFLPQNIYAQIGVFAVVAVVLLLTVRPALKRHLLRDLPNEKMNVDKYLGQTGLAKTDVTYSDGRVVVSGSEWSARVVPGTPNIASGSYVVINEVDGATLLVTAIPQS